MLQMGILLTGLDVFSQVEVCSSDCAIALNSSTPVPSITQVHMRYNLPHVLQGPWSHILWSSTQQVLTYDPQEGWTLLNGEPQ